MNETTVPEFTSRIKNSTEKNAKCLKIRDHDNDDINVKLFNLHVSSDLACKPRFVVVSQNPWSVFEYVVPPSEIKYIIDLFKKKYNAHQCIGFKGENFHVGLTKSRWTNICRRL